MQFLDANIFVRFLAHDDIEKAEACLRLFQRLEQDQEEATTSAAILAEVVFVLSSRRLYAQDRDGIAVRLRPLLLMPGLRMPEAPICLRALDLYARYSIDFPDALSVAHMERRGITEIISYDRDFERIPDIVRVEP